ncbi:CoA-binding protein [Actinokineospora sp. HUAS TT18]|uniref:CoA-binding protein n=1 Tax=Actinokineospora sp. HUAS TT18 TaxID=3447451 RepID=UPI003F5208C2
MHRAEIDPIWQDLTVIERLVHESRTVAVVGLSPTPTRPSHIVASYLVKSGLRVFPVNPNIATWEGLPAFTSLRDIGEPVDIVDVFRRPEFVPEIAEEAVEIGAGALWLQMGVISEPGARIAADGGLDVVMDRCLRVEHREVAGWS